MRQTTTIKALLASLLLSAASLPAAAQLAPSLPGSIVESPSVGSAERGSIDAFIAALSGDAQGEDEKAAARAHAALVKPLRDNRPSVAFRQAYAASAASLINGLIGSESTAHRLAGLRLAGNLATADSAGMLVAASRDDDAGVRLFAAVQARRAFEVSSAFGPALTNGQATTLVNALADAVPGANDHIELEALVRALGQAAQLRPTELAGARARAATRLGETLSARVSDAGAAGIIGMHDPVLLASTAMTRAVSDTSSKLPDASAKAAAQLGGHILSATLARELSGANDADPAADIRLIRSAESLIYFARRLRAENARANPSGVPSTDLAGLLESGSRDFRRELVALIGPGSALLTEFGFKPDQFVK